MPFTTCVSQPENDIVSYEYTAPTAHATGVGAMYISDVFAPSTAIAKANPPCTRLLLRPIRPQLALDTLCAIHSITTRQ